MSLRDKRRNAIRPVIPSYFLEFTSIVHRDKPAGKCGRIFGVPATEMAAYKGYW
jgi:hypothetical protein